MEARDSEFERFIRRAHARRVLWVMLEAVGVCALVATGAALVFGLILLARGEESLRLTVGLLALSVPTGAWLGWTRRPTLLDTAVVVDHQLRLDELLSSALASRGNHDAWAEVLRSVADAACGKFSLRALMFRRFGGRAWGGIGLGASLVIAIGLLGAGPAGFAAGERSRLDASSRRTIDSVAGRDDVSSSPSVQNSARRQPDIRSESASESSEARAPQDSLERNVSAPVDQQRAGASASDSRSAGMGSAKTDRRAKAPEPVAAASGAERSAARGDETVDGGLGGVNGEVGSSDRERSDEGLTADHSPVSLDPPARQSERINGTADDPIPAASTPERSAPAGYGDLVRRYFSRE